MYISELVASGASSIQFALPTTLNRGRKLFLDGAMPSLYTGEGMYKLEMQLNMEMPSEIKYVAFPNHPELQAEISGKY